MIRQAGRGLTEWVGKRRLGSKLGSGSRKAGKASSLGAVIGKTFGIDVSSCGAELETEAKQYIGEIRVKEAPYGRSLL